MTRKNWKITSRRKTAEGNGHFLIYEGAKTMNRCRKMQKDAERDKKKLHLENIGNRITSFCS